MRTRPVDPASRHRQYSRKVELSVDIVGCTSIDPADYGVSEADMMVGLVLERTVDIDVIGPLPTAWIP